MSRTQAIEVWSLMEHGRRPVQLAVLDQESKAGEEEGEERVSIMLED